MSHDFACDMCDKVFNSCLPSAAYMRHRIESAFVQIMACRLFGAKPLFKPMVGYCQQTSVNNLSKYKTSLSRKCTWKHCLPNGGHFVQGERGNRYRRAESIVDYLNVELDFVFITKAMSFLYLYACRWVCNVIRFTSVVSLFHTLVAQTIP